MSIIIVTIFLNVWNVFKNTPSEAVCESIGSVIGNHLHNRNVQAENLMFQEIFITWKRPDVHNGETFKECPESIF